MITTTHDVGEYKCVCMKDLDGPKLKYMHFFQDSQLLALRKKVYLYKKFLETSKTRSFSRLLFDRKGDKDMLLLLLLCCWSFDENKTIEDLYKESFTSYIFFPFKMIILWLLWYCFKSWLIVEPKFLLKIWVFNEITKINIHVKRLFFKVS